MPKNTTALGLAAETMAAEYLESKGCRVIARNHRTRYAELDLVVCNKEFIVFVEVKYRKSANYGGGSGAITADKLRRLHNAAEVWLAEHQGYAMLQPRVDVITVEGDQDSPVIEHISNITD